MSEILKKEIKIQSEHDLLRTRKIMRTISKDLGYDVVNQTKLITAISELTRNVILYAGKGTLFIEQIYRGCKNGLRIRVIDSGPGIPDINKVMVGGYSTSGGLGKGLSGTKRLMDEFIIHSEVGKGTEIIIIKWR